MLSSDVSSKPVTPFALQNEEAVSINQEVSTKPTDLKTKLAAGAILLAKGVEKVAPLPLTLAAFYYTMKVCASFSNPIIPYNLLGFAGVGSAVLATGIATHLGAATIRAFISIGRVNIEGIAGPEANEAAENTIAYVPSEVKDATDVSIGIAKMIGRAAIIDSVFNMSMGPAAVTGLGIGLAFF